MPVKAAILLCAVAALAVGGCARDQMAEDDGRITYTRNSEFQGPYLRVFLTLKDGRPVSVNTTEDAVDTRPAQTPIPGHRARDWTFVKETEEGTSVVYALNSWDDDNPADYLMAGWWAEFPGQHPPQLSFEGYLGYGIVDGPEIDPAHSPELPLEGQATYFGQAGGLYTYVPEAGAGEGGAAGVLDEYEGTVTLAANFSDLTLSGCIGCVGDLTTKRSRFGIFLGNEVRDARSIARDYELHLGETAIRADGTFEHEGVTVRHPTRSIVSSEGFWGGALSNIPDRDGNPRLAAGFNSAQFEEDDGSQGRFIGAFVALSDRFRSAR